MKFRKYPPRFTIGLVVVLLALLATLATLQYRWVGQVSRSERERLQSSLQLDVFHFGEDFDREITRVFLAFQMDASPLDESSWTAYGERWEQWTITAPYPELVRELHIVHGDAGGRLRLTRFVPEEKRFVETEWPPEFGDIHTRFRDAYRRSKTQQGRTVSFPAIVENVPALVIPFSTVRYLGEEKGFDFTSFFAYAVVTLDREAVTRDLVPTLAKRSLGTGGRLDYDITIISRESPRSVVYQSSSRVCTEIEQADSWMNILSVQPAKFSHLLREGQMLKREFAGRADEDTGESVPVRVVNRGAGEMFVGAMPPINDEEGRWQVLVKHREGSLEEVVAHARRRNLAVSLGVVIVLAASVAVLLASVHQAQELARRQMNFVAGVSHELRTPLAVIYSAAENLADGVIDQPEKVRRYGGVIRREGRRLREMVEQVLEFAGVQAGRGAYELRPVDVGDVVHNALTACRPGIEEGEYVIEQHIEPDLPFALADKSALSRAIQNLLNNAMKYGGEARRVKLSVDSTSDQGDKTVRISVRDWGLGIAPDDLPHVFEQFYRGREAVAAQIHGNGLGLSLVKHIVEGHGGRVEVESLPGHGSTFTIFLPALEPSSDDEPDAEFEETRHAKAGETQNLKIETQNRHETTNSAC